MAARLGACSVLRSILNHAAPAGRGAGSESAHCWILRQRTGSTLPPSGRCARDEDEKRHDARERDIVAECEDRDPERLERDEAADAAQENREGSFRHTGVKQESIGMSTNWREMLACRLVDELSVFGQVLSSALSVLRQHHMQRVRTGNMLRARIAERAHVETCE